jgi:glutathione S-transferase
MSEFVVHSIPGSPFGRAVLAMFEEKRTRYRLVPLKPGENRAPEHLALNPFGAIPVLEQGGFVLYETQAILRYLDRVLPPPALTPTDPRDAARMDQVMNINDWYLFRGVGSVIAFQRLVGPKLLGLVPDEAAIAAAMPQAHRVCGALSKLLGGKSYFAGETMSLADLLVGPHIDFLAMTPEWQALTAARANLVAWIERVRARASFQATTWERVSELAKAA